MKKRRKIVWSIIIVSTIGIAIFCFLAFRDEPPFDDSDLQLVWLNILDDENALTYFMKAADNLLADEKEYRAFTDQTSKGVAYDPLMCEAFLVKHKEGFELLTRGFECKQMEMPRTKKYRDWSKDIKISINLRRLGGILGTKALHEIKQGMFSKAIETAITIEKFGYIAEYSKGTPFHYMSSILIRKIGLERIRQILQDEEITNPIIKPCIGELELFRALDKPLIDTMKVGYLRETITIEFMIEQNKKAPSYERIIFNYRFKPGVTKRLIAEGTRSSLTTIQKPWTGKEPFGRDKYINEVFHPSWSANSLGRAMVEDNLGLANRLNESRHSLNTNISATQILIALKCYQLDHSYLPETLDTLVPEYLDKVPTDDFDGKPIKYSKKDKTVYSVGPDMKDSKGRKEWHKGISTGLPEYLIHDDEGYKIEF